MRRFFAKPASVRGLAFLLGIALWLRCSENPSQPEVGIIRVEIYTSLLGGTEGFPDSLYAFVARLTPQPDRYYLRWDFGDGTTIFQQRADTVYHRFETEGMFLVWVGVYDPESDSLLVSTARDVNIRRSIPQFPMVYIPPGTFVMGSTLRYEERPPHTVQISQGFWMSATEVTQQQWRQLMGYNPSWFEGDNRPVEQVSWYEVIDFCNRLSLRAGLQPCYEFRGDTVVWNTAANGYRLPTEAEWEYACRAGRSLDFANGEVENPYAQCELLPVIDTVAWYCGNSEYQTHPVGQKSPNPWGLYDMHGNVAEWTWDVYDATYYRRSPRKDPTGPPPFQGHQRSIRGGSWRDPIHYLRAPARFFTLFPFRKTYTVGFRVVRNAP